ncbi:MAG: hypothetical protein LBT33_05900 [Spirochaetia bacterium]|jgi:hypothetical protein|nr:hypothetical protein [Spirochaetia bacterium]
MKHAPGRPRLFALFPTPLFFFGLWLCGASAPLCAQDAREDGAGYFYFEKIGGQLRFVQRIAWEGEEHAYRYEITIEKQSGAGFVPAIKDFTAENFIEVSLSAGHYRYRIAVHDLFDMPGAPSAWREFDVRPALPPEIRAFSPEAFWLDEDSAWTLSLDGRNLTQKAEACLRSRDGGGRIVPLAYIPGPSGTNARLVFDPEALQPGLYEVYIKNPGGLETQRGTIRIAYRRAVDIDLSLGYGPLVPLYGDLNTFFDKPVFPLGLTARAGFLPLKRTWAYLGLELVPFLTLLSTSGTGYEAFARYEGLHVNALLQKWLPNRTLALNFRLGAGFALLDNLHFEFSTETTEPLRTLMSSLGGGFSLMWLASDPFFLEAGAEYMHFFSVDPVSPGYLRPILGGGYRF